MAAPLLIALPQGSGVSGVTVWAARLANAISARGRAAALLVHGRLPGHAPIDLELDPRVERFDLSDLPLLESAGGDLSPWLDRYRQAVDALADRHGGPVVLSPNLLGDCYGLAAALCASEAPNLRVVGWHHAMIDYNDRVLARYEPILARLVAVSDAIERRLRQSLPHRARDVMNVPYGVPVPARPPKREPREGRALRLIYTGRIEAGQKRVGAIVETARQLDRCGVAFELELVGDGPAAPGLDRDIAVMANVRRFDPMPPAAVAARLARADAFLLASAYEGLSVSMLEAMAQGCVPIVTRVESGAGQVIRAGRNGELAEPCPGGGDAEVGRALAGAVLRYLGRDAGAMSRSAWRTARLRFSIERHAAAVEAMLDAVTAEPARCWPAGRPAAFSGWDAQHGSGSVPPEGPGRLAALLARLGGRRVAVHGTGRHTRQLEAVLAASPAEIVAFADDDPDAQRGMFRGRPIVAPQRIGATGATDVVISSWINQDAIWRHRDVYEAQGLTVHRLYEGEKAQG